MEKFEHLEIPQSYCDVCEKAISVEQDYLQGGLCDQCFADEMAAAEELDDRG